MPTARSAVAYATYKDRIYIAGGEFQDEKLMAAIPRHGLAGALIGNRLHLVTGEIQSAGIQGAHLASESHDAFEFETP